MYELEAFYGLQFDVLGKNGLNCLLPKKGDIKCAVSDETRQKQSKASKGNTYRRGKKMRPESIEKIRLRKIGSKATPETKAKMSKAQKGKPKTKTERKISEAHKKAISDCNKNRVRKTGYKMPQHAIEKMKIRMAGNQYGKGAKHTPEMNKKKSETTKSQPGSLKALEARNKLVLNTQTGIYYDTAKEAAETQTRWNKKYIHNMLGGYKKNNSPFIYV